MAAVREISNYNNESNRLFIGAAAFGQQFSLHTDFLLRVAVRPDSTVTARNDVNEFVGACIPNIRGVFYLTGLSESHIGISGDTMSTSSLWGDQVMTYWQ